MRGVGTVQGQGDSLTGLLVWRLVEWRDWFGFRLSLVPRGEWLDACTTCGALWGWATRARKGRTAEYPDPVTGRFPRSDQREDRLGARQDFLGVFCLWQGVDGKGLTGG